MDWPDASGISSASFRSFSQIGNALAIAVMMSCVLKSQLKCPFPRTWVCLGVFWLLGRLVVLADPSVTLTWNPSPDTNAVGYDIYYGGASETYTNSVFVSATTTVTVSGLCEGATYYFSATTVSASGAQSTFSNEATYVIPQANTNSPGATNTVAIVNQPPVLDAIPNLTIFQGASPQTVILTGIGPSSLTAKAVLKISASSSNPRLIPAPLVRYPSPAQAAQLILRPSPFETGLANITVSLSNEGASNDVIQQAFTVAVLPIPPPTLDPIANVTVAQNAGVQTLTLTGIVSGLPATNQVLKVVAFSSNPRVVSNPTIQYAVSANTALLTFTPSERLVGEATITVMVTDDSLHNDYALRRFTVTVTPPAGSRPVASAFSPLAEIAGRLFASSPTNTAGEIAAGTNVEANLTSVVQINGQFSFLVTGLPGGRYVVQASSDLTRWTSVETNAAPFIFQDSAAGSFSQRFYRALYFP